MEVLLHGMMNLVAIALAIMATLAAFAVGVGNVRQLSRPLARLIFTPLLALLALWILFHGIQHTFSG